MDAVEEKTFVPAADSDPLPELADLLDSPTVKNAPLWSGAVLRYSRRVAPQYVQRIPLITPRALSTLAVIT